MYIRFLLSCYILLRQFSQVVKNTDDFYVLMIDMVCEVFSRGFLKFEKISPVTYDTILHQGFYHEHFRKYFWLTLFQSETDLKSRRMESLEVRCFKAL